MEEIIPKESTPKNTNAMPNLESGATLQAEASQLGKAMKENAQPNDGETAHATSDEDAPNAYGTPEIKEADDSSDMQSVSAATPAIQRLRQSRLEFKINSPSDALGSPDVNQLMRSKLKNKPLLLVKGPKHGH